MPRLTHANPSYRRHRVSGQAVVTINGRDHYLGPHGTKTSKAEYDRWISEWLANGRRSPEAVPDLTVVELVAGYLEHAQTYYRDTDGNPTFELSALKLPLGVLVRLYGRTPAAASGPLSMEAVRNDMIAKGWGRASINSHVGRLRRMFKWAVAPELLPVAVHQALSRSGPRKASVRSRLPSLFNTTPGPTRAAHGRWSARRRGCLRYSPRFHIGLLLTERLEVRTFRRPGKSAGGGGGGRRRTSPGPACP